MQRHATRQQPGQSRPGQRLPARLRQCLSDALAARGPYAARPCTRDTEVDAFDRGGERTACAHTGKGFATACVVVPARSRDFPVAWRKTLWYSKRRTRKSPFVLAARRMFATWPNPAPVEYELAEPRGGRPARSETVFASDAAQDRAAARLQAAFRGVAARREADRRRHASKFADVQAELRHSPPRGAAFGGGDEYRRAKADFDARRR